MPPARLQTSVGWVDPADAFAALFGRSDADVVWLDSGPDAVEGRSIIAVGARLLTASVDRGTVTLDGRERPGTVYSELRRLIGNPSEARFPGDADGAPAFLGWYGWLGYEAGAAAAGAPVATSEGGGADAAMLFADRALVFDHGERSMTLVAQSDDAIREWSGPVERVLAHCAGAADAHEAAHPVPAAGVRWRHADDDYLSLIRRAQASIRDGDAYQLCLTNRATAATSADPLAVHLRLRRASPAHHAGFLRLGGEVLVSSSPEQFLEVDAGRRVRTKPIKGTRPRGATVAADLALRAQLEASEKEQAENVMIVDLMRNDLGRVCEIGSVEVRHLLAVESYAQVHQLVSTVAGTLRRDAGVVDVLEACFPAGSMTGAPKLSAMRILHALEDGPRGVYAGCFGRIGPHGTADLAMVIRSVHFRGGRATIGAGGGITALSVPEEELEEVRVKARALLRAAGLSSEAVGPPGTD